MNLLQGPLLFFSHPRLTSGSPLGPEEVSSSPISDLLAWYRELGSWVEETKNLGTWVCLHNSERNERGPGNLRSWNFLAYHHSLVVRLSTEVNRTVSRTFFLATRAANVYFTIAGRCMKSELERQLEINANFSSES
jgi:hypothetical protein